MFRRLLLVAACSSLAALVTARLAGAYVSRALSALPRLTASASAKSASASHAEPPLAESSQLVMTASRTLGAPATGDRRRHPPAKRTRVREQLAGQLDRGIRRLAEHHYEIARPAFELARQNLGALSRWIRIAPEILDGRASGFRLVSVAEGGPFAKLGLRTDDVLVSVNGLDIRKPDSALDAIGKLKSASHFAVGFLRDGRELMHDYAIR